MTTLIGQQIADAGVDGWARTITDLAAASGLRPEKSGVSRLDLAPSFWVLEDPEGNRVCLCTWQGRD